MDSQVPNMAQSRAKLWIRTGMLVIFGTIFGISLVPDMLSRVFPWFLALIAFLACLPIGLWMSRLVPMRLHPAQRVVTLSFDKFYFSLIIFLVLAKLLAGKSILNFTVVADSIMCAILGLMVGRIGGICMRVNTLKKPGDTA